MREVAHVFDVRLAPLAWRDAQDAERAKRKTGWPVERHAQVGADTDLPGNRGIFRLRCISNAIDDHGRITLDSDAAKGPGSVDIAGLLDQDPSRPCCWM
ncbi:MAG: hypothetical protein U5Q44_06725 [Dehalococcoidia bacterium]|nr:hypothetical protein [Dehalococcoidia bacterium]